MNVRHARRVSRAVIRLSGLLVAFAAQPAWAQLPDPGAPGPLAVTREMYDMGDTAFTPPGFPGPVEVRGSVVHPTDMSGGPFPLIVFLHGRHATCYQGAAAFLEWPCSGAHQPIPSYQGYDYVSDILASWGYIVVSISANGINARDNGVFDLGMAARGQLMQYHLDLWNGFNTSGGDPFGNEFVGKVNLQKVGTMGHSRGGEGVVYHVLYNAGLGSPYTIQAVLPLAPVDFNRPIVNIPLAVPLPYCDGDVSDLQGIHFYDDARYNMPGDLSPKHTILVMGANHDFFNSIWTPGGWPAGTNDDWLDFVGGGASDPHCGSVAGNHRLTPAQQRGTGLAYMNAFFRVYVGGENVLAPYLTGDAPPPPSAMTSEIRISYHPPDDPMLRLDLNRMPDPSGLTINTLGGAVVQNGVNPYEACGGDDPEAVHCLPGQPTARQPHTVPSARSSMRGLSQLKTGWDDNTMGWENDLPAPQDVSGYRMLQFRAGVNYTDSRNPMGVPQNFSVKLIDANGASASAAVGDYSNALYFPPGGPSANPVPKLILNTVRIPLTAFAGVDLTQVVAVQLNFDRGDRPTGGVDITDLMFADPASR